MRNLLPSRQHLSEQQHTPVRRDSMGIFHHHNEGGSTVLACALPRRAGAWLTVWPFTESKNAYEAFYAGGQEEKHKAKFSHEAVSGISAQNKIIFLFWPAGAPHLGWLSSATSPSFPSMNVLRISLSSRFPRSLQIAARPGVAYVVKIRTQGWLCTVSWLVPFQTCTMHFLYCEVA